MTTDPGPNRPHGTPHKEAALSFLHLAATGKVREAYRSHVSPSLRHHNPFFCGDADSLMTAMEENSAKTPDQTIDVQRALEDGDVVAVHSHVIPHPGARGWATVHLFRFAGERIVEMWDVIQEVPESSPNENGVF